MFAFEVLMDIRYQTYKKSNLKWSLISYIIMYKLLCAHVRTIKIRSLLTAMHGSGLYNFNYRISEFLLVKVSTEYPAVYCTTTHTGLHGTFIILPNANLNLSLSVHFAESPSNTDAGVKCLAES